MRTSFFRESRKLSFISSKCFYQNGSTKLPGKRPHLPVRCCVPLYLRKKRRIIRTYFLQLIFMRTFPINRIMGGIIFFCAHKIANIRKERKKDRVYYKKYYLNLPSIFSFLVNENYVADLEGQLILAVGRIRDDAAESARKEELNRCGI